jgi:hypothetical protein
MVFFSFIFFFLAQTENPIAKELKIQRMFHGHLHYFQILPLGSKPNTKPRDNGTPNAHNR